MPLFCPDGPQIHPLVLCLLSTPPLLLSSLGLIPEGARISQAPMSASFTWVSQRGRQQETGGKKCISSLPSVLGVFPEATSFPPWLQLPADQPIRGSFFQPPFLFSAYMYQ